MSKILKSNDNLLLIRAVFKASTALHNFDDLSYCKEYRHMFKKDLNIAVNSMISSLNPGTKKINELDSEYYMHVTKAIDATFHTFKSDTEFKQALCIFYVKIKSALHDLKNVKSSDYVKYDLIPTFTLVLNTLIRHHSPTLTAVDNKGNSLESAVEQLNKLGEELIFYTDGSTESDTI